MHFTPTMFLLSTLSTATLLLVCAFAPLQLAKAEPASCHLRELDLCMTSAIVFVQQPQGFKASEAEVERQCELFKETEECVDEFEAKCTSPMQRAMNQFMSSGILKYMQDYCKKGSSLRRSYLKHSDCVNKQRKNINKCLLDLQAAIEKSTERNINEELWRDRPKVMCCALDRYKTCSNKFILPACGQEAVEVGDMVMKGIFSRAASIACDKYKAESETCKALLPAAGTKPKGSKSTSVLSKLISTMTNA